MTNESDVKVVDRRWWARGENTAADADPVGKPSYVEELEQRLAEKDRTLQGYISQYKSAAQEFEEARARTRRDIAREIERGKRTLLVELLDVLDNLDRALEAARESTSAERLVEGVTLVRQQFMTLLQGHGITEIDALGQPFDPHLHEAVSIVPAPDDQEVDEERVAGVIRRGYRIGDEVLRPALVAVAKKRAPTV
ncbi:MAG TPA: nucleotide exchange factor GrpE [Vicinamibacterales bacterium]|nr:nucleotide exchange factor GrpE [Vicinamibacterales bacterium]